MPPSDLAASIIRSAAYQDLRAEMKAIWRPVNAPCGICGIASIDWDGPKNQPESFELDHRISRKRALAMNRPELLLDPSNAQPSHCRCNRAKGAGDGTPPMGETSEDY